MTCGDVPVMPQARPHDTGPAHTVSTLQRASLKLGIPLLPSPTGPTWRGSPNSAVVTHQSPGEGASIQKLTLACELR